MYLENNSRNRLLTNYLKQVDLCLAPSNYAASVYHNILNLDVKCNKNGIKEPAYIPKKLNHRLRFAYVGGNHPIKGINTVLNLFRQEKYSDIELVVVDNTMNLGITSFAEQMFQGITHYSIEPAYTQETIDQFFSSIDVLLFPSQCKETFGLTVREAIIRNVWVISSDAGGVVEDIVEGKNGIIVPFNAHLDEWNVAMDRTISHLQNSHYLDEFPKQHIRTFEQQKAELLTYFAEIEKC